MKISYKVEERATTLYIESLLNGKHWDSVELLLSYATEEMINYNKYVLLCRIDPFMIVSEEVSKKKAHPEDWYFFEEDSDYQGWYKEHFFIDGEDASEFLKEIKRTTQSRVGASYSGVHEGWKYYKMLRARNFNRHTAANLAFWRGYIDGMDWNNSWEKEGTEALDILGLERRKEL